jgi:hypothetical protein
MDTARLNVFHLATSELPQFLTAYGYWAVMLFVAIVGIGVPVNKVVINLIN